MQYGVNDRLQEDAVQHGALSSGARCQQPARPVSAGTGRYSVLESVIKQQQWEHKPSQTVDKQV